MSPLRASSVKLESSPPSPSDPDHIPRPFTPPALRAPSERSEGARRGSMVAPSAMVAHVSGTAYTSHLPRTPRGRPDGTSTGC